MKVMKKQLKGTVCTIVEDKTAKVDYIKVLEFYAKNWGEIPKSFGNHRAFELHIACRTALAVIETLKNKK
jgi:hypothetical protein